MFKIGDFAKFTSVSVKQLRHYDEIGLLKPRLVDPYTGYRYYAADQLPRLNRILALRDLGFGLEQISRLLDDNLSLEQLRGMLKLRRAEIEQQVRLEQTRLARVEVRLQQIEAAETAQSPYEVVVRSVEPILIAGIRHRLDADSDAIADCFDAVERFAARGRVRAPAPPLMVYHEDDAGYGADAGEIANHLQDVEVMVPLTAAIPASPPVQVRLLPGYTTVACVIHTGGYDALSEAFASLLRWIEAHGYRRAGPLRELFLRFGASPTGYVLPPAYLADTTAEFVTELQLPITWRMDDAL
jgi:DNA-binding transcriptional MerR regulator